MVIFGMAEEYRAAGIACNALWPRTTIATAAVEFALGGKELMSRSRRPQIMADAAYAILCRDARQFTGNFVLDEQILRAEGTTDFEGYAYDRGHELELDIFVDATTR
jgi:citronellol/citronellal dehydrogenase